jgi:hypothetical protein
MTRSEIDALPIGSLLHQPKYWGLMVVTANNLEDIRVIRISYPRLFLSRSIRPRRQEFRLPKRGREAHLDYYPTEVTT